MSLADLKKRRNNNISRLVEEAKKITTNEKKGKDDTYWQPGVDKSGNGFSVIRFMPAPKDESLPWVRYWDHGFKGPTGLWYIEKSLTTLGLPDPCSERNSLLWNTGREEDKELARVRKRRLHYVSNVYVISDPSNRDNEGKVFKFVYGKKIFEKIVDLMQPQFEDESPIDPFDFWDGCDFKLKIRNFEGYRNYDKSEFAATTPFLNGDEKALEAVYDSLYSLAELVDPKTYPTYEELEKKLNRVLGTDGTSAVMATAQQVMQLADTEESPIAKMRTAVTAAVPSVASATSDGDDEDADMMEYFKKLANS